MAFNRPSVYSQRRPQAPQRAGVFGQNRARQNDRASAGMQRGIQAAQGRMLGGNRRNVFSPTRAQSQGNRQRQMFAQRVGNLQGRTNTPRAQEGLSSYSRQTASPRRPVSGQTTYDPRAASTAPTRERVRTLQPMPGTAPAGYDQRAIDANPEGFRRHMQRKQQMMSGQRGNTAQLQRNRRDMQMAAIRARRRGF